MESEYRKIVELIRYGHEEELKNALVEFINQNKSSEEGIRIIRRLFLGLRLEPRMRVKKIFLTAVAETAIWDPEVLDTVFLIARDDPEPELRELAEKVALKVLETADKKVKKDVFIFLLKAIDRRLIYISPTDLVRIGGLDLAREIMNDERIGKNLKDLLQYGIEASSKSK